LNVPLFNFLSCYDIDEMAKLLHANPGRWVTEFQVSGLYRHAYCGTATTGERCQRLCRSRCVANGQKYSRIIIFLQALPTTAEKEVLQKRTIGGISAHIYVGTICSLQKAVSVVQGSNILRYVRIGQVS
jgi:hypothetical protein